MDSPNALPGTFRDFRYYEYIEFMKPLRTAAVSISDRGRRIRGGLVLAGLNGFGWKASNGKIKDISDARVAKGLFVCF